MGRKIAANHIATAYPWALASPGPSVCDPKIQTSSSEFLKFLFYHKEFPFFFFSLGILKMCQTVLICSAKSHVMLYIGTQAKNYLHLPFALKTHIY